MVDKRVLAKDWIIARNAFQTITKRFIELGVKHQKYTDALLESHEDAVHMIFRKERIKIASEKELLLDILGDLTRNIEGYRRKALTLFSYLDSKIPDERLIEHIIEHIDS